jgi:hypothetical protein
LTADEGLTRISKKGLPMKISHVWKSGRTKKKTRSTYKIRWEVLGLSRPDQAQAALSMDTIRSEVSLLATQRLSERKQAAPEPPANGRGQKRTITGSQVRRRGATE